MGLFNRPRVKLLTPVEIVPGEPAELTVILECKEPIDIAGVTLTLSGTEFAGVGSGKHRTSTTIHVLSVAYLLHRGGRLEAGKHRLPCRLQLPREAPPTYQGADARTEYEAKVHVDIPWWPDVRRRYALRVGFPEPAALPPSKGIIFSSNPAGPRGGAPHFEASLASGVLVPGDRVRGSFALNNTANNRYKGFALALIGREHRAVPTAFGRVRKATSEIFKFRYPFSVAEPREGEPVAFEIGLPSGAFPSARSQLWSVDWSLEIELDIAWALNTKLEYPLIVTPPSRRAGQRLHGAAPSVGSRRVAKVWEQVAALVGMTLGQGRLHAEVGGVRVEIGSEFLDGHTPVLVAHLEYPSLGLDLAIRKGRKLFKHIGLELDFTEWDGAHTITGREKAQVAPFVRHVRDALAELTVRSVEDERAVVYAAASAQLAPDVELFARRVRELARAIDAARSRIPLPAAVEPHAAAWRDLAARLEGRLDPGAVAVTGTYRGSEVEVRTTWSPSGEPFGALVTLKPRVPVDAARAPDEPGLTVEEEELRLSRLPLVDDPLAALADLRRLADLAETLTAAAPYR